MSAGAGLARHRRERHRRLVTDPGGRRAPPPARRVGLAGYRRADGCGGDPGTGQQTVSAGGGGTTANTHLPSPVQPSKEPSEGPVDRRFPTAVGGWQLYFLVVDTFRLLARQLRSTPERIKENRSVRTSG